MAGLRILVVEDEVLLAMLLERDLKRLGHTVVGQAAMGESVLDLRLELAPDLVLMDIRLAGIMDGIEAAAILQLDAPVPVIFLTAYSDAATRERALKTSALAVLQKPLDSRAFEALVAGIKRT